jgi:hypothetical protein
MSTAPELEEVYPAAPDQLPPVPRYVAWNAKAHRLRVGVFLGLFLVPTGILAFGWLTGDELRALEDHGRSTTGEVTEKTTWSHKNSRTYRVRYSYEAAGRSYSNSADVSSNEYAAFTRGERCPVVYLEDKPNISYPGRPGPVLDRQNTTTVVMALFAAVAFAIWLGCVEFFVRRELWLAREGETAVGRIIERGTTQQRRQTLYWARHEYTSPSQQICSSWHYIPQLIWENLHPGLRVTLLFDPANPARHMPLYAFKYAYIAEEETEEQPPTEQELEQQIEQPQEGEGEDATA